MAEYPLAIVTFLFGRPIKWQQLRYEEYTAQHVNALWRACADNIKIPHRFVAYTDSPDGIACERRPSFPDIKITAPDGHKENGCYQRLRMYDPEIQASLDADFVLILDLDTVFMHDCTDLIAQCMQHDFVGLRGSPWLNGTLCSYVNGSFQMCRTGARPHYWHDFNPAEFWQQRELYRMPGGKRPHGSDQAWLTVRGGPDEHTIWEEDGAVQYRNHRARLSDAARLVFFAGKDKPWFDKIRHENSKVSKRWWHYAEA